MDVAWGDKLGDESQGQDILGIRGLDQSIEAALVNGITTVSQRGRYLTILPWAVGEFFDRERQTGATVFDQDRLRRFLFRVEYLTLACTVLDEGPGDGSAALGTNTFGAAMIALREGQPAAVPQDRSAGMLLTYFGPCRALGLIGVGEGDEPFRLPPRGQKIWEARNTAMAGSGAQELLKAESLDREAVRAFVPHFSLKRLADAEAEAELLRDALTVPWEPNGPTAAEVADSYARFGETLAWLRDAAERPLRADALLSQAWRRAAAGGSLEGGVRLAWAEYEGRRRLHYGLELLLSAVAGTLEELSEATLDEVMDAWLAEPDLPEILIRAWPGAAEATAQGGTRAVASVPADLWLEDGPPDGLSRQNPHARALAGFALVVAIARQSAALRADGRVRDRESWGEKALAVVDSPGGESFRQTLRALAAVAVQAHLDTTFRKMASGLRCSLRFFPEGRKLRTTGLRTGAGLSGPRLWNVIRVLQDAGVGGLRDAA